MEIVLGSLKIWKTSSERRRASFSETPPAFSTRACLCRRKFYECKQDDRENPGGLTVLPNDRCTIQPSADRSGTPAPCAPGTAGGTCSQDPDGHEHSGPAGEEFGRESPDGPAQGVGDRGRPDVHEPEVEPAPRFGRKGGGEPERRLCKR